MKKNVLVFPCGSEIGLEIYRSLRFSKDFKIIGGSSVDDHGRYVFENYIPDVPFVNDENFIAQINKIIDEHDIDFVIPAHDSVVLRLAQNASSLNATIVTSPKETCEIARSKSKTYQALKDTVRTPKQFNNTDDLTFPMFLKPDVGQGSKGALKVDTPEELEVAIRKRKDMILLEYLPGDEYTVDCFTDRNGNLLFAQARERARIANGISVNSKTVEGEEFWQIATKINSTLKFRGVWFFQLKRSSSNELTLLEIAPRVAGTMGLSRMRGANLPLLGLYDAMDMPVYVKVNEFKVEVDRALKSEYKLDIKFETVYIDFDDTLILEESPNYLLIGLIYKFIEAGKKIVLITKHVKIIKDTLAAHKISPDIFDEIISLRKEDAKSEHIQRNSIFIDDSFSERAAVMDASGVPVFDVSEAVELL